MPDVLNPEHTESQPLNTEMETPTLEATAAVADPSTESTSTGYDHEASPQQQHASSDHQADPDHQAIHDHLGPQDQAAPALHAIAHTAAHADQAKPANDDPEYDEASMEDFAKALESFDREQAAESASQTYDEHVVTGTVVKLTDKHVIIDVGQKSEGIIPLDQVMDAAGQPKLKPGDTVEVVIERETPEGLLVSYEKAQRHKVWDVIEKAANDKTPVKGMVLGRVKGGLTVDIGIKAFLPGSQVEVRPVRNLDGYIGQEMVVRVIKLNKKRGNVVVSRKELLEEDQLGKREHTLASLAEGAVLTGTVKNLTDYGAFVELGGLDGLLHITDMSWGRLTHPRDLVNVGDEIQVKVLKFDRDKQRVSLGFKQLTPDPWLDATERYPIGARVTGRVLSVTDYGSFIELEQGIEGLVHVSEMSWSKRMKHPSKLVKPGDEVETVVLAVNPVDRRISLGMKQLQENPWEQLEDKYPAGTIVEGRVRNLTDFGAFIEIEDGIDGLVHVSNLSWTKRVKHPSEILKKGEKVKAIVLGVEPENRRLSLGIKQLQPDVWETFFAQHRVGDVIKGKVLRSAQFGTFVEIAEGVEGLCHVSEAADAHGQPVKLEPEQEHEFKIIKMSQEEKKVGLSLRAVGEEGTRAEVEAYKESNRESHKESHREGSKGPSSKGSKGGSSNSSSSSSTSSGSTTLGDLLNWKKSERE